MDGPTRFGRGGKSLPPCWARKHAAQAVDRRRVQGNAFGGGVWHGRAVCDVAIGVDNAQDGPLPRRGWGIIRSGQNRPFMYWREWAKAGAAACSCPAVCLMRQRPIEIWALARAGANG